MLLYGSTTPLSSIECPIRGRFSGLKAVSFSPTRAAAENQIAAALAAAVVFTAVRGADVVAQQPREETLSNVPQLLSSVCAPEQKDCRKRYTIQRPKSRRAETCTSKCSNICMQGGFGSPGEGPFSVRRPLVVFKEGFRSRKYCLSECSDICNLIGDGDDDGP